MLEGRHHLLLNAGSGSPASHAVLDAMQQWHTVKADDPVHFVFETAPHRINKARRDLAA